MKFILSTNYKLAFRLLNEGATLAAWLDRGIHRDIGKVDKSEVTRNIAITANQHIYRYLPTIYDAFEADCNRFNIEFLIPAEDIKQDARDRAQNEPLKSLEDLRRLMGNEVMAKRRSHE